MTGDDLGPILFGARGINYHVLWYTDDDDSLQTKNHTKGLIWFTADGDGSIEIELRFFDKSITYGVRGTHSDIPIQTWDRLYYFHSVMLEFEAPINMNGKAIKDKSQRSSQ